MQHTHTLHAKKEVINVFNWIGSGVLISEIQTIFEAVAESDNSIWDKDEEKEYRKIINAVIFFIASLNEMYENSKMVNIATAAEIRAFGEKFEPIPETIDSLKLITISKKLFSSYPAKEITDTLWECYFECLTCKAAKTWKRLKFSNLGFTIKIVTQLINEMDVLIRTDERDLYMMHLN